MYLREREREKASLWENRRPFHDWLPPVPTTIIFNDDWVPPDYSTTFIFGESQALPIRLSLIAMYLFLCLYECVDFVLISLNVSSPQLIFLTPP